VDAAELSLVLVRMGGRACAIPCEDVVEIIPRVLLSHVPDAPPEVVGVINLRGRVVPVVDARARLAGPEGDARALAYQHLVIVRAGSRQLGVVVDEVVDVVGVAAGDVEMPGDLAGLRSPGVVRVGEELVLVLGPEDFSPSARAAAAGAS
jgi:purine-binding chemotaxis protein CheW